MWPYNICLSSCSVSPYHLLFRTTQHPAQKKKHHWKIGIQRVYSVFLPNICSWWIQVEELTQWTDFQFQFFNCFNKLFLSFESFELDYFCSFVILPFFFFFLTIILSLILHNFIQLAKLSVARISSAFSRRNVIRCSMDFLQTLWATTFKGFEGTPPYPRSITPLLTFA